MADERLAEYLNDHLAGSVGALALVEHQLQRRPESPVAACLKRLLPEIEEDQACLAALVAKLGAEKSGVKRVGAWLSEKASRLKLDAGPNVADSLGALEALEALVLGIHGKRALWRLMESVYSEDARFSEVDFGALARRAEAQHDRAEELRLEVATLTFSPTNEAG